MRVKDLSIQRDSRRGRKRDKETERGRKNERLAIGREKKKVK